MASNPYLEGNYSPVSEEVTSFDLPVNGTIPDGLDGTLLRIGPNPINADPATYHWFNGDGMLHGIDLRDGRAAAYRNRWVRTDSAVEALGEDPSPDQAPEESPLGPGASNTNVVAHAGRILALEEAHLPVAVTRELATVGRYDFGGALRGTMAAHPKIDPETGEMLFFGSYNMDGGTWVNYHVADASGRLTRSEPIEFAGLPMVHDFNVTESHVVWMDLPVVLDADLLSA
ncbi:MAG: carotenoid oxygenase family protein, partial [Acidimicrobiales bacterium]